MFVLAGRRMSGSSLFVQISVIDTRLFLRDWLHVEFRLLETEQVVYTVTIIHVVFVARVLCTLCGMGCTYVFLD